MQRCSLSAAPAAAWAATPATVIERGTVIEAQHLDSADLLDAGALAEGELIGMQAARRLVPGRPIRAADIRTPHAVERGSEITVQLRRGALTISAPARALQGGGVGEAVRIKTAGARVHR